MKTNQEVLQTIVQECWENPSFIDKLKSNPVSSIETLTGRKVKLPEGTDGIVVVDQTDQTKVFINIPAEPNLDNMELTDSQMELVSGGSNGIRQAKWEILTGPVCWMPADPGTPIGLPGRPDGSIDRRFPKTNEGG